MAWLKKYKFDTDRVDDCCLLEAIDNLSPPTRPSNKPLRLPL